MKRRPATPSRRRHCSMPRWSCPGCDAPLQFVGEGMHVAWICQPCQLTWVTRESYSSLLGRDSLNQLVTRLDHSRPPRRELNCPQCRQLTFHTLRVGPVEFELCTKCHGMILEPGEAVAAIRNELTSSREEPTQSALAASGDMISISFEILEIILNIMY